MSQCAEGLQRDFVLLGVCVLVTVRLPRILGQAFIQQERQQLAVTVTSEREGVGESVGPQPVRAEGWWFCEPRQLPRVPIHLLLPLWIYRASKLHSHSNCESNPKVGGGESP